MSGLFTFTDVQRRAAIAEATGFTQIIKDAERKQAALFEPKQVVSEFIGSLKSAQNAILDCVETLKQNELFKGDNLTREEREAILAQMADATLAALLQAVSAARPDAMNLLNGSNASNALMHGMSAHPAGGSVPLQQ